MTLQIALALLIAFLFGAGIGRTMGESVAWQKQEEEESDETASQADMY